MRFTTHGTSKYFHIAIMTALTLVVTACQPQRTPGPADSHTEETELNHYEDDLELLFEQPEVKAFACTKANREQLKQIKLGNQKLEKFLQACSRATGNSAWCTQLTRPNPGSRSTFNCTYSSSQPHKLIHPDEATWKHAFGAVLLIQDLERKGLRVCSIYNWWRPEPYNKNVGGAAGRHPSGTSVDVRFCSNSDANRGFDELCKYRRAGRLRAIGHYGTSALHFGVGDRTANTWGRSCPK